MSTTGQGAPGNQPTEEELRAAYEAEIKKIRVEQVLLEQVVTLINLGMRRTGIAPGTESERDPGQVRVAIEAIRALMPLVEQAASPHAGPIRDALSQLQLAYVRIGGQAPDAAGATATAGGAADSPPGGPGAEAGPGAPPPAADEPQASTPGEPGPAQRSGRLWVPGQ
jgi:hypothetical protein